MMALAPWWPLLQVAEERTEWRLLSAPEAWVAFLVVCVIALVVFWAYRGEKESGLGRWLLAGVRLATILLVLFVVVFQLSAVTERVRVQGGTVVCLLDSSLSMSIEDRFVDEGRRRALAELTGVAPSEVGELSRAEILRRTLTRRSVEAADVERDMRLLDRLAENNDVVVYGFDTTPHPLLTLAKGGENEETPGATDEGTEDGTEGPPSIGLPSADEAPEGVDLGWYREQLADRPEAIGTVARLTPDGRMTAVTDALNQALIEQRNRRIAGVVLVSDGRSTAGILPPDRVTRRLRSRDIPLYAVAVGNPDEPRDIAVADAHGPEVVLAGDRVSYEALVTAQGFPGEEVGVDLLMDGRVVAHETTRFDSAEASETVRLQFVPDAPREEPYEMEVRVPERAGEITAENNARQLPPLRVVDNRIRVLYIEGGPRWEYRYLKNTLIRDETMEVQCWLNSASSSFPQEASPDLSPLRDIPYTRDGVVQPSGAEVPGIFDYDVIVIGDVRPSTLGDERMELMKEFVESGGGGLLMISGTDYTPDEYRGTPLETLLPVVVDDPTNLDIRTNIGPIRESFNVRLTEEGRRHPVMRLVEDPAANIPLWEGGSAAYGPALPGFYWYQKVQRARPGATVLATHPHDRGVDDNPVPVIATMYAGSGMTFWMGVDSTWRWRAGIGDRHFARFWGQVIRHLATGKLLKTRRFTLQTDRPEYDVNEEVRITATVLDRDMKPAEAPSWTIHHELPNPEGGEPRREEIELTLDETRPGTYRGTIPAHELGSHRIWIGPVDPGENRRDTDDELSRSFLVVVPRREFRNPRADEEALRALVEGAGAGEFLRIEAVGRLPDQIGPLVEQIPSPTAEDAVWDHWWVLLLVAGLLAVEWIGRKFLKLV